MLTNIYDSFITNGGKILILEVTNDPYRIAKENHFGNVYNLDDTVYFMTDGIYLCKSSDNDNGFGRVVVFDNKYIASKYYEGPTKDDLDEIWHTVMSRRQ